MAKRSTTKKPAPKPKPKKDSAKVPAKRAATVPAGGYDYGKDAGGGFEGTTSADFATPFLRILQALSPQLDKHGGDYIKGAEQGEIFNTADRVLSDGSKGLAFIPCAREHAFPEFIPRDSGGGFQGQHAADDAVVAQARETARADQLPFGKLPLENGNELVETFYVYGYCVNDNADPSQAVLAFTSTQIKKYRQWMAVMRPLGGGRAPMWAHRFRLRTKAESNEKGHFYGWDIRFDGKSAASCALAPDSDIYLLGKALHEAFNQGRVRPDYAADSEAGDEDVPF